MRHDLRILRVVLIPPIVQRLAGAGQANRRDQLGLEAGAGQMIGECAMVVAVRQSLTLERNAHRMPVLLQRVRQPIEVGARVEDRQTSASRPARHRDEHFVAMLGDVDAYENGLR